MLQQPPLYSFMKSKDKEMLNVLFEDNHMLVLIKPAGIPTQPSLHHQDSLETRAKTWLKAKYEKPYNVYLNAIHRLDKPVSGIVVFAKTSKALSRLQASIRNKLTKKNYMAHVFGHPPKNGTFQDYLIHDDFIAKSAKESDSGAKLCKLSYETIQENLESTLVKITLDTGRYHQIRAQFATRGYPILGDFKYGSKIPFIKDAIALHHCSFSIPHPITNEEIIFNSVPSW